MGRGIKMAFDLFLFGPPLALLFLLIGRDESELNHKTVCYGLMGYQIKHTHPKHGRKKLLGTQVSNSNCNV